MKSQWKIFINSGYKEEFEMLESLVFNSKKEAQDACRKGLTVASGKVYHYPQKCIVTVDKWNELKS